MTTRDVCSGTLFILIATSLLAGCSSQKSDAPAAAPANPAQTQSSPVQPGRAPELFPSNATKLAADYQRQCAGQEKPSRDCEVLRGLLVAQVSTALELVQRSRDQRGVERALAALDLPGEPEIFIAACRILGNFPMTPGIVPKVLPQLLENRYVEVQRVSATLLTAIPNPGAVDLGRLWLTNHGSLSTGLPYEDYPDFPAHYAAIGFPKYPGAAWFSPADSDRSVGWSTKDDMAAVTRWFTQALHTEAMDAQQWLQLQSEQAVLMFQNMDQSKMTRMQEIMGKVAAGDQAAVAEFEKLQKEMDKTRTDAEVAANNQVINVVRPPDSQAAQARWIVAKKNGKRVSTIALLYPMPGLQRTVIQLAWDLSDYPSAWPKARE